MYNEKFGRLLKTAINAIASQSHKTAGVIDEELASLINSTSTSSKMISAAAIQRYKRGFIPPDLTVIDVIASQAIKKGRLNEDWLKEFLKTVRHPGAANLVEQFCKTPGSAVSEAKYSNLPAPDYNQFVMREAAYQEVITALGQRNAVVIIAGFGGNGKTSLAREIVSNCFIGANNAPKFESIVWISDKDNPGHTTLNTILDTIAQVLDYPGCTQMESTAKCREVDKLLRRYKVLLILDNYETMNSSSITNWVTSLPEPSKALITSRETSRELCKNSNTCNLLGLSDAEAWELIRYQVKFLKLEWLLANLEDLTPLLSATGNNPKTLVTALGLIKYGWSLQRILDDLDKAHSEEGLFEDLFEHSWSFLDKSAQKLLISMTLFPDRVRDSLLAATAGVGGFRFNALVEQLRHLALIDEQRHSLNEPSYYSLHPLVRAYAKTKLASQPSFESAARERWLDYFMGQVPGNIKNSETKFLHLTLLAENEQIARSFLDWFYQHQQWKSFLQLYEAIELFWSTQGLFQVRETYTYLQLEAARNLKQAVICVRALSRLVRIKSYQNDLVKARVYCEQAKACYSELQDNISRIEVWPRLLASEIILLRREKNYQQALNILEDGIKLFPAIFDARVLCLKAGCLYDLGRYDEAFLLFTELSTLGSASERFFDSNVLYITEFSKLLSSQAVAYLKNSDKVDMNIAEAYILRGLELARSLNHKRVIADLQDCYAKFYLLNGSNAEAREALVEAVDLYERMGMLYEYDIARKSLANLANIII